MLVSRPLHHSVSPEAHRPVRTDCGEPASQLGPRGKSRRLGQSMVELALILPLVIGILFAIIDLGYYLYVQVSVGHATREGVRIAAMNNRTRSEIRSWIRQTAPGVQIPSSPEAIAITTNPADADFSGTPPTVAVTVTFSHTFLVPLFLVGKADANVFSTSKSIVQTFETAETITF